MSDLTILSEQTIAMPKAPYQARHFIDGRYVDSADGRTSDRVSPSHGVVVSQAALGSAAETEAAITSARAAFDDGRWSRLPAKARAAVLSRVADLIEQNTERLAVIETLESGKSISQARGECGGAANLWRSAASLARTAHGDSHNTLGADILGVVVKEPIGVVSIITPWNFPFWILSQKLPFALAAGCTCVVKPSEVTPSTTAMLGALLHDAGLPAGVCNIVLGYGTPRPKWAPLSPPTIRKKLMAMSKTRSPPVPRFALAVTRCPCPVWAISFMNRPWCAASRRTWPSCARRCSVRC